MRYLPVTILCLLAACGPVHPAKKSLYQWGKQDYSCKMDGPVEEVRLPSFGDCFDLPNRNYEHD